MRIFSSQWKGWLCPPRRMRGIHLYDKHKTDADAEEKHYYVGKKEEEEAEEEAKNGLRSIKKSKAIIKSTVLCKRRLLEMLKNEFA